MQRLVQIGDYMQQPAQRQRLFFGRAVGQFIAIESDRLQGILDVRFRGRGVGGRSQLAARPALTKLLGQL